MNLTFFIQSSTVNLKNYSIKDLPGSSGRFDVISRCVLATLLNGNEIEKNVQIWVFLSDYGTFIFDISKLSFESFPKTELSFAKYFIEVILNKKSFETGTSQLQFPDNPLNGIKFMDITFIDALKDYLKNDYKLYILNEKGIDFFESVKGFRSENHLGFVIGNQSGINSEQLNTLNLINVSFGSQSYLASSVIKLIKLYLLR